MKQEALSHFTDIHLTILALFIFITLFTVMVFVVYSKSRKKHYETMANLQLKEGDSNE